MDFFLTYLACRPFEKPVGAAPEATECLTIVREEIPLLSVMDFATFFNIQFVLWTPKSNFVKTNEAI